MTLRISLEITSVNYFYIKMTNIGGSIIMIIKRMTSINIRTRKYCFVCLNTQHEELLIQFIH